MRDFFQEEIQFNKIIVGKHQLSGDACLNHKPGLWGSGRLAYSNFVVQRSSAVLQLHI